MTCIYTLNTPAEGENNAYGRHTFSRIFKHVCQLNSNRIRNPALMNDTAVAFNNIHPTS